MIKKEELYKIEKCVKCGSDFIKSHYNKVFCSKDCCNRYYNENSKPISYYLIDDEDSPDDAQTTEEMFQSLILCPKCKKPLSQYWKKGKRHTKHGEDKDLYTCLMCGYNFTLFSLSFRMQHSEKDIIKFINLRKKGINPNQIVKQKLMNIGTMTAYRWDKKYSPQIIKDKNIKRNKINNEFWQRLVSYDCSQNLKKESSDE